jgi:hypothetical protein
MRNVVMGADVRVIQGGYRAGLALEVLAERFGGNSDTYVAIEPGIDGAVCSAHPALAQLAGDLVVRDLRGWSWP